MIIASIFGILGGFDTKYEVVSSFTKNFKGNRCKFYNVKITTWLKRVSYELVCEFPRKGIRLVSTGDHASSDFSNAVQYYIRKKEQESLSEELLRLLIDEDSMKIDSQVRVDCEEEEIAQTTTPIRIIKSYY